MVYFVSGSNIFGQWFADDVVLNKFFAVKQKQSETEPKVLQINWAYNILYFEDGYYLSGVWNGKENQLVKIPLPPNNTNTDIIVKGNDYSLIFICISTNTMWVMDLKMEKDIKKINFIIEEPHENFQKKQKRVNEIQKAVLFNDSCLYLMSYGNVYCGILPSYVDTRHCKGEICDIQCGYEHYILLTSLGSVYTWGNGRRLQLGHGDISNVELPREVEALAGIKITKISSGGWHSLAISEFGDLYAWGWNDVGQLGIKHHIEDCQSHLVPMLVDIFDENEQEVKMNVIDVACGSRHTAILLEDNTVWTTGSNKYGQLGIFTDKCLSTTYFRKVFHCDSSSHLICGPWTTVIVSDK